MDECRVCHPKTQHFQTPKIFNPSSTKHAMSTSRHISNGTSRRNNDEESLILGREAATAKKMTEVEHQHQHYNYNYYGAVDDGSSRIGNGNGHGGDRNFAADDGDGDGDGDADTDAGVDADDALSSYDNQQHPNQQQQKQNNQNHTNKYCYKRYPSNVSVSTVSTTTTTGTGTTTSSKERSTLFSSSSLSSKAIGSGSGGSSSSSSHRVLRLVLIILVMSCCYIGFYAVFALWTHHNHPDGVFGEEPNDYLKKHSNTSSNHFRTTRKKTTKKEDTTTTNNNNPPPTKFLFGNIGSVLLGWPSSSSQKLRPQPQPSSNPIPRSILLMLHAEAVPANDYVMLDEDRPLTATGMQQSERLGSYLAEHNIAPPDWIFCSPSVRTSYTLELVRRHWASKVPVAFENILYVLAFNDYFAFVAGLNRNFRRVLIVGHNPAILNTAKKLMSERGLEDFPTAGFLEISWDDQQFWFNMYPSTGSVRVAISGGGSDDGFFDAM